MIMNVASTTGKPAQSRGSGALDRLTMSKSLFFAAAFASFLLSVGLWFAGDRERGLFVGIWVPSILSAGNLLLSGGRRHD